MVILTPRQKLLIELGRKKGYLTHTDFNEYYAHAVSRQETISRFISLGIITPDVGDKFKFNEKWK